MRIAFIVIMVGGVLSLAIGIRTWVSTGPGSGFQGHTPGFRLRLYALLVMSLVLIATGAYGLTLV